MGLWRWDAKTVYAHGQGLSDLLLIRPSHDPQ